VPFFILIKIGITQKNVENRFVKTKKYDKLILYCGGEYENLT